MPRHPDPDLEERILKAADGLWRRGGARALTMRAVARAAGTNTPAVYRRFKDRQDLVKGILRRIAARIRHHFEEGETLEEMCEAYLEYALKNPNEYQLFFTEARLLNAPKGRGAPRPIRESRPNFDFAEKMAARELGGAPEDYARFVLVLWSMLHGTAALLLTKSIPEGHEEELRSACRAGIKALIGRADGLRTR
ncbi:MAG TPA: TetR/AcrR family transcriptional regulator [Candidatus Dormibacteraeota bacterium]|nr:TetR/AcrR family transcriptional regulator [Candidatus Dormibacteraeota bacterium]